ncbi:MAG: hypothetical protein ABSH14_09600 [Verrucomicrobiia bacterium]|jgi:hypothetical protein
MNWMSKLALLVGRKKFEDYAQANPTLPDDALAVANTLDTYPVRGAVTLIAGSLAHAADNVLRGSETFEQLVTHALLILTGLCIIWVRHAISKHDVQVNDALQKARVATGIAPVVKLIIAALLIGGWGQPLLHAQTNSLATGPVALQDGTNVLSTTALFTQLVSDVGHSTKFSSGVGVNLHGKFAPLLSQELSLFGETGTNSAWSTGPSHATFFLPAANEEQLGWSYSVYWYHAPKLLRFALFNADDIDMTINWGLPVEDYYQFFRHVDWRDNRFGVSITRKF